VGRTTDSRRVVELGLDVSQATVAKYMVRGTQPPSQTWRTFLANHRQQIAAADFFVVPTVTCRLLFVLVILAHERRRVVHVAVTDHPTAAWAAQQLREAFPLDEAPRYLLHDRDTAFHAWATTATAIGIEEVVTAVRSPWQNAYAERLIGSIRRECLDHIIIGNAHGLRCVLRAYAEYYLRSWTHLSLGKDAPVLTSGRFANRRRDRGDFAPWWPSPPVRTPRRVKILLTDPARRQFHSTHAMGSSVSTIRHPRGMQRERQPRVLLTASVAGQGASLQTVARKCADDVFSRDTHQYRPKRFLGSTPQRAIRGMMRRLRRAVTKTEVTSGVSRILERAAEGARLEIDPARAC
jgi:transposase InsO family protein